MTRGPACRRRSPRGFTLVELMVSLVLFAFVTAGMLSVAATMARGFREQEATISAEAAARSALDFLAEAVRSASPGVPSMQITNSSCTTGAIAIKNNVDTGGPATHTSDKLTMVYPSGGIVTALAAAFTTTSTTLTVYHSQGYLVAGDQLLVINTDFTQGHIVTVTGVFYPNVIILAANSCPPASYDKGATVIRVKRAAFYVKMLPGDALNAAVPALMMDSTPDDPNDQGTSEEPIAEGIEDLQIAVAYDLNSDQQIYEFPDGKWDEWKGEFVGSSEIPDPLTGVAVRALRISLIARTTREASGVNTFTIPALLDRAEVATNDNFRRRALSTIVELRNLTGSP